MHRIARFVAVGMTEQGQLRGEIAGAVAAFLHGTKPVGELPQIAQPPLAQGGIGSAGCDLCGVAGALQDGLHQFGGALML